MIIKNLKPMKKQGRMSIKNLKPRKNNFKQGYYRPINMSKYIGEYPIIYRSGWEKKFCEWCDLNPSVIKWSSEPFSIKYFNLLDNKYHTYWPDFWFKRLMGDKEEEYVVEIKPKEQLKKPKVPKRKTPKIVKRFKESYNTYVKNLCKTEALKKFADSRNLNVLLLTEESKLF